MESLGATAQWLQRRISGSPALVPTTNLEPVKPLLDTSMPQAAAANHSGCTWPPEKSNHQRSQMVAAWQGNGEFSRIRQMHEPHVGGVPRSVLSRVLGAPSEVAPGTPIHSPRRRCSAASASVVSMVHSPRKFANSDRSPLKNRDPTAQTVPCRCCSPMFPTPDFGGYESSSNCSSRCNSPIPISPIPINHFPDYPIQSDEEEDEREDEVAMLRQQVALLIRCLEDEKKRRATEQNLMQTKIIELQGLIRGNDHGGEDGMDSNAAAGIRKKSLSVPTGLTSARENERLENNGARRWSAPVEDEVASSSCGCTQKQTAASGEVTAKLQLTRLRARMHAIVIDTQRETQTLRSQLEGAKRIHNKREKQLALETTIKVTALQQKHAVATTRLAQQAANNAIQVEKLEAEKQELLASMQAQRERLEQLELALGGKRIVDASR